MNPSGPTPHTQHQPTPGACPLFQIHSHIIAIRPARHKQCVAVLVQHLPNNLAINFHIRVSQTIANPGCTARVETITGGDIGAYLARLFRNAEGTIQVVSRKLV